MYGGPKGSNGGVGGQKVTQLMRSLAMEGSIRFENEDEISVICDHLLYCVRSLASSILDSL